MEMSDVLNKHSLTSLWLHSLLLLCFPFLVFAPKNNLFNFGLENYAPMQESHERMARNSCEPSFMLQKKMTDFNIHAVHLNLGAGNLKVESKIFVAEHFTNWQWSFHFLLSWFRSCSFLPDITYTCIYGILLFIYIHISYIWLYIIHTHYIYYIYICMNIFEMQKSCSMNFTSVISFTS